MSFDKTKQMSLPTLLDAIRECDDTMELMIPQIFSLVSLGSHLREHLRWRHTPGSTALPSLLPPDISNFFCSALDVNEGILVKSWYTLRPLLEMVSAEDEDNKTYRSPLQNATLLPLFLQYGLTFGIGIIPFP